MSKAKACGHQLCLSCRHPAAAAAAASPASAAPSPPPPLFGRPAGCIDQLTTVERAAIVTLDGLGWLHKDIAHTLKCSENTVSLWIS
jgi:DNA-directed RNA polymerase specialized sigma24 family protein